ncbi:MAG: HAMP domain-containing histidine kinase [Mogibacterium sp.]|nr:HAMP domain-containing histidine kinase [Mogibacterium sp.]
MKKKTAGREWFIIALAVAVLCVALGINGVWRSFERFDSSILSEKDTQLYSLMRSGDINLENSINAIQREAETFLGRERLRTEIANWKESGDTAGLRTYISNNTLATNPIYADLVVSHKDKIICTESGSKSYSQVTGSDSNGMSLWKDDNGTYYMAWHQEAPGNITYDVLIDLLRLYSMAIGKSNDREIMLLDASSVLVMTAGPDGPIIMETDAEADGRISNFRDFMMSCQKEGIADGISVDTTDEAGNPYTARMVALPSGNTVNGEFAMGIFANYEEAIAPSRKAAEEILFYGGLAVIGVAGLLLLLILMRRANAASSAELRVLKKKNETMEEINQKMQALAHHQRLETIGTMTASIAHDFNNLLTPIMGYSIMTMEMLPADATDLQDNLMEIYDASVKAKDIVTRLAELTKKGNEESFREIEVDEVIQSALKVTLPAKPKEVEVKANFNAEGEKIKADSTQISQLVMNIVLNAYDAMRENGGTLLVSTRISGEEVVIRFKDNGCGMDTETMSRIFDPFYTTKESGKGTGLGLAIVAQIVETHGGKIYVDSEPGEGTEFRVYIPLAGAEMESLAWGPGGEGKFDTKRYSVSLIRKELARIQAEKEEENRVQN